MRHADLFKDASCFVERDGLFYQKVLAAESPFELRYVALRKSENRLYDDETVMNLPEISSRHVLKNEWRIRKNTLRKLTRYLNSKKNITGVMEVGCGNGWLINALSREANASFIGLDINLLELQQAARVFGANKKLQFLYADIQSDVFSKESFDIIILASVIQYFSDPASLLSRLVGLLRPGGEIHILESPLYEKADVVAARMRSVAYFKSRNSEIMAEHYFHHDWSFLNGFSFRLLSKPKRKFNKIMSLFIRRSPFPWIVVAKGS